MDDPFADEANFASNEYSSTSEVNTEILDDNFRREVLISVRRFDKLTEKIVEPKPLPPRTAKIRTYLSMNKADHRKIDFMGKPEFPTGDEFTATKEPKLPKTIPIGPYPSKHEYLETQYGFTREDAIRPLRDAVAFVKRGPDFTEKDWDGLGFYDKVYVVGITFSTQGISTRVTFSTNRCGKQILWKMSKRLIAGTLVVLSPKHDMFHDKVIVARVVARPTELVEKDPPEVDLVFTDTQDLDFDPLQEWVMVEHRGSFFEAERYTLLGLQQMKRELSPSAVLDHLVEAKRNVDPPEYLLPRVWTDLSPVFGRENNPSGTCYEAVDMLQEWPEGPPPHLDISQEDALKRILTKKLAVVQGPPGTGKTHVSVQALKVLLANHRDTDPPIVIACQTNHALDQLLRHVADINPDEEPPFVRLGSRTQDDLVRTRTVYEVKEQMGLSFPSRTRRRTMKRMFAVEQEMRELLLPYSADSPEHGILSHLVLHKFGFISQAQAESLEDDWTTSDNTQPIFTHPIARWLGKSLVPVEIAIRPWGLGLLNLDDYDAEELQEHEVEALKIGDIHLKGAFMRMGAAFTTKPADTLTRPAHDKDFVRILNKREYQDLHKVPQELRELLYSWMEKKVKATMKDRLRHLAKRYNDAADERRIGKMEEDFPVLRSQNIIGCTLTGFNKHRALLATLAPKIVLIEEAAEVLEGPVATTFLPSVEHTILVGDHKQLKPHCHVRLFENDPHYFNTSLFERLIENGVEYTMLALQRRMKPEISRLLYTIYGGLIQDHPSVHDLANRPDVPGAMGMNSCFVHHTNQEERDELYSYYNPEEAKMIVRYCAKFVKKGLRPEQITVLTFYNGQRKAIIRAFSEFRETHPFDFRIKVVTVDSYQGEENDVVFLSLVRNNPHQQLGFVNNVNRICVALSRARCGLYIFGNVKMMRAATAPGGTWNQTVNMMENRDGSQRDPPTVCPIRVAYGGIAAQYNRWSNDEGRKRVLTWLTNGTSNTNMSDSEVDGILGLESKESMPSPTPMKPRPGRVFRERARRATLLPTRRVSWACVYRLGDLALALCLRKENRDTKPPPAMDSHLFVGAGDQSFSGAKMTPIMSPSDKAVQEQRRQQESGIDVLKIDFERQGVAHEFYESTGRCFVDKEVVSAPALFTCSGPLNLFSIDFTPRRGQCRRSTAI